VIIAGLVLLVAGTTLWWLFHNPSVGSQKRLGAETAPRLTPSVQLANKRSDQKEVILITKGLEDAVARLSAANDPQTARAILAELRQRLDQFPHESSSRALQQFLSSSRDASTKLEITVGPGGALSSASSLRVFLFDYLAQIDRAAAGVVAAQVLSAYTTPDEWTINLRNYAWANPGESARAYLQEKAKELISNPAWRSHPTTGFLESFDIFVYARAVGAAPELTEMVRDSKSPATAHAAYLALDRLTIADPSAMLKQLVEQPDLMKGREQTRANFVARADIGQSDQRELVEQYLLDSTKTPEELDTFAALYPNANLMVSNNLLTPNEKPDENLAMKDQAALNIVKDWERDPRFEHVKPVLARIRQRLEDFVSQAASGRP